MDWLPVLLIELVSELFTLMFEVEFVDVPLYAYDVLVEEDDVLDKLVVLELD
ncbi:MAG: hypothetical protein ACREQ5_36100 [Candidatus Dormibacteria bacterium]